jgi:hypothetical protein
LGEGDFKQHDEHVLESTPGFHDRLTPLLPTEVDRSQGLEEW